MGFGVRSFGPDAEQLQGLVAAQGDQRVLRQPGGAVGVLRGAGRVVPLGLALAGGGGVDHRIAGGSVGEPAGNGVRGLGCGAGADQSQSAVGLEPGADRRGSPPMRGVPINPLHARGFVSIGCAPCTRAIGPGEDERAGRWWWEQDRTKECGLHVGVDGKLVRNAVLSGVAPSGSVR